MHELSLALEIRSICERTLARERASRLTGVGIQVGAFSGADVESLRFCLESVLAERFGGDVRCEIEQEPGRAECPGCGTGFGVTRAPFECPECGSFARGISGGDSLQVSYLELE